MDKQTLAPAHIYVEQENEMSKLNTFSRCACREAIKLKCFISPVESEFI